jgi:amidase
MIDGPLHEATTSQLATAIGERHVSARDATAACLTRIADVNPRINAVVQLADGAIESAELADAELAAGRTVGPLHGVPFTIKDSYDTAGVRTTAGTVGWRDRVPATDATVVARLRAAGAVLMGKTNTPEFTWSNETTNRLFGATSNPYDLARSPGGSSGGSAAIVAAGGSPFDVGSDTADSIRLPSHYCGVAGIKPTQGRVSRSGHWPSFHGIVGSWTQLGPIARSVADLDLVLRLIAGPDGRDPHVQPIALGDPAAVDLTGLRVALVTDNGVETPTPETIAAVREAGLALTDAGASVEERRPEGVAELSEIWWTVAQADGHAWLRRLIERAGTPIDDSYPWLTETTEIAASELTRLLERIDELRGLMTAYLGTTDVIVSPAAPRPAFPHGEGSGDEYGDSYCEPYNLTGWPAGVVRGGTAPGGLPIGVQAAAGPWREDRVLATLAVIEAASGGWQRPAI